MGQILQVFKREVATNQRIYFDFYSKYLCSGNTNGSVSLWNSEEFDVTTECEPILASFKAQSDCVNGVSFNPVYPLLATASGQRKFFRPKTKNFKECENKERITDLLFSPSSSDTSTTDDEVESFSEENSLKIWKHKL